MAKAIICLGFSGEQLMLETGFAQGESLTDLFARNSAELTRFDSQWQSYDVAIFGKRVSLKQTLKDGDQIELLRPLTVDPKLARQRRVEVKRRQFMHSAWRRNSKSQRVKIDAT